MTVKKTTRFLFEPIDHSLPTPTPRVVNWGANNVASCREPDKHGVCHKCDAKTAFDAFLEENGMFPIGGDLFEDAGGHVWHESNIEDEIKHQKKGK